MVTLLYRTMQSTLGYGTVIQCTWVMAESKNFAFKISAKPLPIETWLLLTAGTRYRTIMVPLPTTYGLATIHALQTDRQTTDRTQNST